MEQLKKLYFFDHFFGWLVISVFSGNDLQWTWHHECQLLKGWIVIQYDPKSKIIYEVILKFDRFFHILVSYFTISYDTPLNLIIYINEISNYGVLYNQCKRWWIIKSTLELINLPFLYYLQLHSIHSNEHSQDASIICMHAHLFHRSPPSYCIQIKSSLFQPYLPYIFLQNCINDICNCVGPHILNTKYKNKKVKHIYNQLMHAVRHT